MRAAYIQANTVSNLKKIIELLESYYEGQTHGLTHEHDKTIFPFK
jgi:hypothetical protein